MSMVIEVQVVYRMNGQVMDQSISIPSGYSIKDCLSHLKLNWFGSVGIWGEHAQVEAVLKDGDRLELYEDLIMDPKELRKTGGLLKCKRTKK